MRIAHVISTPEGVAGAERILASLLAAGNAAGFDQMVINPFANDPDGGALAQICREADPDVRFLALPCRSSLALPVVRRQLVEALRGFGAELVHAHLFHAMVLCASARKKVSAPMIATHHHGDHNVMEGRRARAIADRHCSARFDAVVAISDYVRRFLIDQYGIAPQRIRLIHNGWSGVPLEPQRHSRPRVVSVARLREQKGHAELLAAFAAVRGRVPDAELELIGDGPLRPRLERRAAELGLTGCVRFRGDLGTVWPSLAAADAFVLASRYEPLGVAVMEAMAAGLPIVATAVGGVPELIEDGKSGWLVPSRDVEALASAITEALTGEHAASFGERARERASGLTAARMAELYARLYADLTA